MTSEIDLGHECDICPTSGSCHLRKYKHIIDNIMWVIQRGSICVNLHGSIWHTSADRKQAKVL